MALTMTRTRTQTALTKLAQMVAEVHGELAMLDKLIVELPEHRAALEARKAKLACDRDALYTTLRQFDADIDPTAVGASYEWLKKYGRRSGATCIERYCISIASKAMSIGQ